MSEVVNGAPASAPTTEATPAPAAPSSTEPKAEAKAQKAPKQTRQDFIKSLNAELGLGKAKEPIPTADVSATEEPVVTDETAETASEETPEVADPEPAVVEETPKEEKVHAHKLAALQLEAQRAKSDALKAKDSLKARETELADLRKQLDTLKDPKAALKHAGTDVRKFAQDLIDGKVTVEDAVAAPERDPEVQALLDEAKAARERAAKEAERAQAQALRADQVKLVQGALDAPGFADAYPLVAAMPDAAATMLTWIEAGIEATKTKDNPEGVEPSFEDVAKMVQDFTMKETLAYLKHQGARKTLLADPELAKLVKAVEAEAAPAVAPAAPAAPAPAKPGAKPGAAPKPAPVAAPAVDAEEGKNESPLVTDAKKRAKTLTKSLTGSVPSRTEKSASSGDLAARLNRDVLGRQT